MITISLQFSRVEDAVEFLQRQGARAPQQSLPLEFNPVDPAAFYDNRPGAIIKVRADKGKKRGPYRKRVRMTAAEAPVETTSPERSEPAVVDAPKSTSVEQSGDVGKSEAASAEVGTQTPREGSIPSDALTLDVVKAHMTKLARKYGPDANMKLLADFGVRGVSQLSPEKYPEFVAAVKAAFAK